MPMISALLAGLMVSQTPAWAIQNDGTMTWNGMPYRPVGVRIPGTRASITQTRANGNKHLLVELSTDGGQWDQVASALRDGQEEFGIVINSRAPMTPGVSVEPEAFRLTGITEPSKFTTRIPGASSALLVVAAGNGQVISSKRIAIGPDGLVNEVVDPKSSSEHVALLYPVWDSSAFPDAWERLDAQRDGLLAAARRAGDMPGLRFLIDPAGQIMKYPDSQVRVVPNSERFRIELEAFLKSKYTSLGRAVDAWGIKSSDVESLAQVARLVPLWSARRGVAMVWDPKTDRLFPADQRNSNAWRDIQDVAQSALKRRSITLTQSVQTALKVPVLTTWAGWNGPYEGGSSELSGVAVNLLGDRVVDLMDAAGRATTTQSRRTKPGLFFVADMRLNRNEDRLGLARQIIGESGDMGASGWFISTTSASDQSWLATEGVKLGETRLAGKPNTLFFPESAQSPATTMKLGQNLWWIPSPDAGNRVDFGSLFAGYRIRSGDVERTVIWRTGPAMKVKLRAAQPKEISVRRADGSEIQTKVTKEFVELTLDETPIVVTGPEIPIPEVAFDEALAEFALYQRIIPKEAMSQFPDLTLFSDAARGYKQSPAGSFGAMRSRLDRLRRQIAPHTWFECENMGQHTMSEAMPVSGASGGGVLSLSSRMSPASGVFKARGSITPRFEGDHEAWIAMRAEPLAAQQVRIRVGDAELRVDGAPVSFYSNGFAWYKAGVMNLGRVQKPLEILVDAPIFAPIQFDAVVLSPIGYRPDGVNLNWKPGAGVN